MTTVVNVKVAYLRPQYKDLRDWMSHPNNVYVGRRGIVFIDGQRFPPQDSPLANPFKVGKDGTRDEVLLKYREWLIQQVNANPTLAYYIKSLYGKTLGCWCAPEPCHADLLAATADYYHSVLL